MTKIQKKVGWRRAAETPKKKRKAQPASRKKKSVTKKTAPSAPSAEPIRTVTATATIDRDLALSAITKKKRGVVPSSREVAALKRIEVERAAQERDFHLKNCPKSVYLGMAGRQAKVIIEQATRYGLPLGGSTIDIGAVVRSFHDHLAKYAQVFQAHHADATEDRSLARRLRQANVLQKEAEAFAAAGLWISRSVSDGRCLDMVKWFRFVMNQASSELAVLLGDERSVSKRRRIIATYFLGVRKQATTKGKGDSAGRRRERKALGDR